MSKIYSTPAFFLLSLDSLYIFNLAGLASYMAKVERCCLGRSVLGKTLIDNILSPLLLENLYFPSLSENTCTVLCLWGWGS